MSPPAGAAAGAPLPVERLSEWLTECLGEPDGAFEVEPLPGGFSNVTYALSWGSRRLVLRHPPPGVGIRAAHDMTREFGMLQALTGHFCKLPKPCLLVEDTSLLGMPFYVAERVEGLILRDRIPPEVSLPTEARASLSLAVADTLLELHGLDPHGLEVETRGRPEDYVNRQVRGWSRRYRNAATEHVPEMDFVESWLLARRPETSSPAIVHNDFKLDNLVLDPADPRRVVAVLDWEMATVGDPWMDLGTTLAYWAQADDPEELKAFGVTHLPGFLSRAELLASYQDRGGKEIRDPLFYYVFGIYRNTVVAQQLHQRHHQGSIAGERFSGLGAVVRACARQAMLAIETRHI